MLARNLFAYTAPGSHFPEFLSVNLVDDGTAVTIAVRSPPDGDRPGAQAEIKLSLAEYERLRRRLA